MGMSKDATNMPTPVPSPPTTVPRRVPTTGPRTPAPSRQSIAPSLDQNKKYSKHTALPMMWRASSTHWTGQWRGVAGCIGQFDCCMCWRGFWIFSKDNDEPNYPPSIAQNKEFSKQTTSPMMISACATSRTG